MTISVALCTYNGRAYVAEQLASLADQSRPPDELIVCDDASTDTTGELVQRFAATAPFPVRFFGSNTNVGSTASFARATSCCIGDVIALCDQDDVWKPDKLERFEREFAEHPAAGLVFGDARLVDDELQPRRESLFEALRITGTERRLVREGRVLDVLLRRNVVTGAVSAFRARFRDLLLPIPQGCVHDYWIGVLLSAVTEVRMIEEPLVLYRQHGRQQIGEKKWNLFEQFRFAQRMSLDDFVRVRDMFVAARERLWERARERVEPWVFEELDHKIAHADARVQLRWRGRLLRLPIVFSEAVRGRYGRYSLGWKSVLQDVFL